MFLVEKCFNAYIWSNFDYINWNQALLQQLESFLCKLNLFNVYEGEVYLVLCLTIIWDILHKFLRVAFQNIIRVLDYYHFDISIGRKVYIYLMLNYYR